MTNIRPCTDADVSAIDSIINEAAAVYEGAIPAECWHRPYMTRAALDSELAAGVRFWGWDDAGALAGVMGVQDVHDATLIRHAYVRPSYQGRGIGSALLTSLTDRTERPLLIGTWAAATWAIRFYERHGFQVVDSRHRDRLLGTYWRIPIAQRDASVVLTQRDRRVP